MSSSKVPQQKEIQVWADWTELKSCLRMGTLLSTTIRGKEVFSFEYDKAWLKKGIAQNIDPSLKFFRGPQHINKDHNNFGIFLDSSPDRWGRLLMRRREKFFAIQEKRKEKQLLESDYLLGVFDLHRQGALRYKLSDEGPFLDNNKDLSAPPWVYLRDLEFASLQLEKDGVEDDPSYSKWLGMLVAPGASLGGARPKASVQDPDGNLWVAKFPSLNDTEDKGAWEAVAFQLAQRCDINVSSWQAKKFSTNKHTFLNKRFDRLKPNERIHYASAMTLLEKIDGDDASTGVSYLDLATLLIESGSNVKNDLEQLWRRIVFSICISNTDDHLRNHGFLFINNSWSLSPAFDLNPVEFSDGLKLNITADNNELDLELALEVSEYFRIKQIDAKKLVTEIVSQVKKWKEIATNIQLPKSEINRMSNAFRIADNY